VEGEVGKIFILKVLMAEKSAISFVVTMVP
jgi:hypothetical protein